MVSTKPSWAWRPIPNSRKADLPSCQFENKLPGRNCPGFFCFIARACARIPFLGPGGAATQHPGPGAGGGRRAVSIFAKKKGAQMPVARIASARRGTSWGVRPAMFMRLSPTM
jgi:hypothetical protein